MVLFPIRSHGHSHIFLFASSTWALILHCTNPDTKQQWALVVPSLLVGDMWRARQNGKSSQCTARGTVLRHPRLQQERCSGRGTPVPPCFIPPITLSSISAMKEMLGARKGRKPWWEKREEIWHPRKDGGGREGHHTWGDL